MFRNSFLAGSHYNWDEILIIRHLPKPTDIGLADTERLLLVFWHIFADFIHGSLQISSFGLPPCIPAPPPRAPIPAIGPA